MITITGKNGIKATILAHSISTAGKEMITWEIEYPRLILAELNTHRQLSRNSYSSRAVPFNKMLEQLNGEPVRFGANQAGMQDKGEDHNAIIYCKYNWTLDAPIGEFTKKAAWVSAKDDAIKWAKAFADAGYHKQVYNRLMEPFQMQKTVLSATEVDNFFWLRDDDAADPTIRELAIVMRQAWEASEAVHLMPGEWHLPYLDMFLAIHPDGRRDQIFFIEVTGESVKLTLDQAIKVSCARCAAVSYRNEGYDLAKSLDVYDKLVGSVRKHASAFEHQATPMQEELTDYINGVPTGHTNKPCDPDTWEPGISHMDRSMQLWSGNLQGWIQYRKLIPGECYSSAN